jgi:hypothetical protein
MAGTGFRDYMKTTKRKTHRGNAFVRTMSTAEKKRWNDAAEKLLNHCREVYELSSGFDTAVRDSVASGLAYLVHAAFDCRSIALDFKDFESGNAFIDNSTAEWFRERGYVEWFSAGAASLFNTTPPRTLADCNPFVVIKRRRRA